MIGLINWSGHENLGDDAMVKILEQFFEAKNMGEKQKDADFYILGGGTLIAEGSLFMSTLKHPERTIGISLGVHGEWHGYGEEYLKKFHKIYTRDKFSHERLLEHDIPNTLSVDLLCYLEPTVWHPKTQVWGNIMQPGRNIGEGFEDKVRELLNKDDIRYFALSSEEDMDTMGMETDLYNDGQLLLDHLTAAKTIYATRLHALVLAWVAKCPDMRALAYDLKLIHFLDRVKDMTQEQAQQIIETHLYEIQDIIRSQLSGAGPAPVE